MKETNQSEALGQWKQPNNIQGQGQLPPTKPNSTTKLSYFFARRLYSLLLWIIFPFAILRLFWKSRENPGYRARIRERMALGLPRLKGCILVHAVSVGETVAAVPFIEKLLEEFPSHDILITSTTPTGSDRVKALFGGRVEHCFLPFDTNLFASRLLKKVKPSIVIIIETEIWPNLIYQCDRKNIPVLLANARMSERSYKGYNKVRQLTAPTLERISQIATHAAPDLQRFLALGAPSTKAQVIGSIKFDLQIPANLQDKRKELIKSLEARLPEGQELPFIWVAASTHDGEEDQIIKAAKELRKHVPNAICVLVPRHIERFETVARLLDDNGVSYERFSMTRELPDTAEVLLGDTMGELLLFYSIADTAFVGGSFAPVGGHNVLESLACNTATIVGPHMFNFQTIHDLLMENKAIIQVADWKQLSEQLQRLATNDILRQKLSERGEDVVRSNRGALDRLVSLTQRLIQRS